MLPVPPRPPRAFHLTRFPNTTAPAQCGTTVTAPQFLLSSSAGSVLRQDAVEHR